MPCAVNETADPPPDIIAEEPEWAWSAPEQIASDSETRCHGTQTELASANRVAFPGQLSASIAERRSRAASVPRPAGRYGSNPAVARLYRQGWNAQWGYR
jgi:hypothetical protein